MCHGEMYSNTFTPQIKGSSCGLNVMYHNHSSPGVLELPWCATTSQWKVVLPIGMHIIMLQHPLECCKTNAHKLNYHSLYRHTISTIDHGFEFVSDKLVFRVRLVYL